jgi:4-amino-4-deoxy-L-arabinose transferase-like glycosyltransferase
MTLLLRYRYPVLVLAVLVPRILWFLILGGRLPQPVRDQTFYVSAAGSIASGEGLSYSREMGWLRYSMMEEEEFRESWGSSPDYVFGITPVETPTASLEPGYPLLLAGIFMLTGPVTGGVFLLNSLFALLGAFAMLKLVEENWGAAPAVMAALIWSLYPYYVYYSAYAMTEMIHFSLLPVILLLTMRAASRHLWGLAAGAVSAMLFLIRSTALFLLPLQALWLLFKRRIRSVLLLLAGFVVLCVPWVVRNQLQLGSPVLMPTKGALNLWMRNNPDVLQLEGIRIPDFILESISRRELLQYPSMEGVEGELERSRILMDRSVDFLAANPLFVAYMTLRRCISFLSPVGGTVDHPAAAAAGFILYLPMLVLASFEFWRRRRDPGILLLGLTFLLYMALHSLAHGGVRYRLPVDMVLMVLSSLFICRKLGMQDSGLAAGSEEPA